MNYAENISVVDAFEVLKNEQNSFLVDVRTQPEWVFSGVPDLSSIDKKVFTISWLLYPRMELNNSFVNQVEENIPDKNAKIFFLCKVGGRSADAATKMTEIGYKNCYNIVDGFEGGHNPQGQRGKINGWKASNLPWQQV